MKPTPRTGDLITDSTLDQLVVKAERLAAATAELHETTQRAIAHGAPAELIAELSGLSPAAVERLRRKTVAEALTTRCPDCKAAPRKPCDETRHHHGSALAKRFGQARIKADWYKTEGGGTA
jgi:hypothetical protein